AVVPVQDHPERVPAFLRHHVHHGTIGVYLGGNAAGLQHHLFDHGGVHLVAAVAGAVLDAHAVEIDFGAALTVIRASLRKVATADVIDTGKTGRERHQRVDVFRAGRQRVEQLARSHDLFANVLGVDYRRGRGDDDRFFQRSDAQLGVHRDGDSGVQLDAFI